jgi:hypothetical protein
VGFVTSLNLDLQNGNAFLALTVLLLLRIRQSAENLTPSSFALELLEMCQFGVEFITHKTPGSKRNT